MESVKKMSYKSSKDVQKILNSKIFKITKMAKITNKLAKKVKGKTQNERINESQIETVYID